MIIMQVKAKDINSVAWHDGAMIVRSANGELMYAVENSMFGRHGVSCSIANKAIAKMIKQNR